MRLRLLVFLPLAGGITFLLLLSASSLVSALERSVVVPGPAAPEPMTLSRYETVCEGLTRELHALSHEVTSCGGEPFCEGSPLLCPAALDEEIDHEYRRLRRALHEQCDFPLALIDYAWQGPGGATVGARAVAGAEPITTSSAETLAGGTCGSRHDWLEAATSGEAEPARYFF